MSWFLFLDESGHDHRSMPYEVRGGLALHASKLWPFVRDMQRREQDAFGTELHQFRHELKGCKLLDKRRFKWAAQAPAMQSEERRKHCRGFLTKGLEKKQPNRDEFTAFGQACLELATGIFESLDEHGAQLFASVVPRDIPRTPLSSENYLRKDHVFLFERYYYLLERERQHGVIVMDQVEKTFDRRFVSRLQSYFRRTDTGRRRARWIVPAPLFVSSELSSPVQAADLAIYCINWGFRLPRRGMDAETRPEIADKFVPWISRLQYHGQAARDGGDAYDSYGITYVPDPFVSRK